MVIRENQTKLKKLLAALLLVILLLGAFLYSLNQSSPEKLDEIFKNPFILKYSALVLVLIAILPFLLLWKIFTLKTSDRGIFMLLDKDGIRIPRSGIQVDWEQYQGVRIQTKAHGKILLLKVKDRKKVLQDKSMILRKAMEKSAPTSNEIEFEVFLAQDPPEVIEEKIEKSFIYWKDYMPRFD